MQESSLYFYNQLKTDHWDDWLYSQIIKALKFRYIEKKINTGISKSKAFDNLKKLKLQKLLFPRNDNNYFLKSLALPKSTKIKLNLKFNKNLRIYNDIYFSKHRKVITKRNLIKKNKIKRSI